MLAAGNRAVACSQPATGHLFDRDTADQQGEFLRCSQDRWNWLFCSCFSGMEWGGRWAFRHNRSMLRLIEQLQTTALPILLGSNQESQVQRVKTDTKRF
jgi:hypothetical protein